MTTLADFPRHPLLFGPSPVHRLDRLTAHLGGAAVWAKREDVNSGIAFGGNKTRKLEYLVADALAQGCDTLVSIGGVQSNHTRQVAAVAARVGLRCVLVQESWVDWPDAVYDKVGNILISRLAGADVRLVKAGFGIGFKESWESALREIEARGGKPYPIPAGASDHPLGGLGFANWAHEVAAQEAELGVFFDTVVVCSVTGSTPSENIREYLVSDDQLVLFDEYSQCADALSNGQVDAVTTDNVILTGLVAGAPEEFELVGNPFTEEPYGIGITKGDDEFRSFINDTLEASFEDGSWAEAWDRTAGAITGTDAPEPPSVDRY